METQTLQQAIATFQQIESLQPAEQWQMQQNEIVAILPDGRKVRQVSDSKYEVTTYKGNPATDSEISIEIDRLRRNYTMMKADFFAVLTNELIADQWPQQRIKDAVNHVMRTKPGRFLSIADIFSYDKPMRLYNYAGYCWLINNGRASDVDGCGEKSDFGKLKIGEKVFFYLKKDVPNMK